MMEDAGGGTMAVQWLTLAATMLIALFTGLGARFLYRNMKTNAILVTATGPARPLLIRDSKKGHVMLHLAETDRRRWFISAVRALPRRGRLQLAEPVGLYDKGDLAEFTYGKPVSTLALDESVSNHTFKTTGAKSLLIKVTSLSDRKISIPFTLKL